MTTFAAQLAVEQPEVIAIRDERVAFRWVEGDETLNRFVSALLLFDLGPEKQIAVFAENPVKSHALMKMDLCISPTVSATG